MAERKAIGKKVRFEVFKRDSFKCQYCGQTAPEVILEVDHINPVSIGGDNDILNLITACRACNAGKSDRLLSDSSALAKQRAQLEELNERREQLEQMLVWREGMAGLDEQKIEAIQSALESEGAGYRLNENGVRSAKKLLAKWPLDRILESISVAMTQYLQVDKDGNVIASSFERAWNSIGGILRLKDQPESVREAYYIRGIARNRYSYLPERECLSLIQRVMEKGGDPSVLKALAREASSWTRFRTLVEEYELDLEIDG